MFEVDVFLAAWTVEDDLVIGALVTVIAADVVDVVFLAIAYVALADAVAIVDVATLGFFTPFFFFFVALTVDFVVRCCCY